LGFIQPPIQCVRGTLSLGVKQPGRCAEHSRPSSPKVNNARCYPFVKSRDNSVGIALGYGLADRGSRVRFPAGAGNFSLHHNVQNGSGAHPSSYPMGNRGSFRGVKRPGREADHSPPSSAEVKNAWSYTSTPQYAFMAWCLFKHRMS
jgi:hypothetical protein